MKKILSLLLTGILLGSLTFTGCKKKGDPPEIPPQETFAMDFSQFPDGNQKMAGKTTADTTNSNWAFSVLTVGFWQLVVTVNMAIPVLAFAESFNHEAKYIHKDGGKWKWEYTVSDNAGNTYTAKLYGQIEDDQVNWEMYLSKSGEYEDFLWYDGISKLDNSEGTWTLYKDPTDAVEFVDIVWHRNSDGTSDIKYTNVEPGSNSNGGYIYYGLTNDLQFDAFYDVYVIEQNNLSEIKWNTTSYYGEVRNQTHFGDNDWHCWDSLLVDTDCGNL
ncbi:MAG: hypothetical protein ACE5DN_04810 [Flavobacteriales bacterium]